jgi:hypothetical protein
VTFEPSGDVEFQQHHPHGTRRALRQPDQIVDQHRSGAQQRNDPRSLVRRRLHWRGFAAARFRLARRKLDAHDRLQHGDDTGLCLFANAVKGVSSLQFARDMGCNAKTAFVMLHKIRESVAAETKNEKLCGEIEIDGAFFGGHIRPANLKANRIDRRFGLYQTGQRRVVVALRQRQGRTLPFVSTSEAHGVLIASRAVKAGSTMIADEAAHWDALHANYETKRINHTEAYSLNGVHTNFVESYFSRLRRMVQGSRSCSSCRTCPPPSQRTS